MKINDRVRLNKTGALGTIGDTITDHVTSITFYIVEFDNGEFDTYAADELANITEQKLARYKVRLQRQVIEEVSYEVYANDQHEADMIARECLSNDETAKWEFPENWCSDTPLNTYSITEIKA